MGQEAIVVGNDNLFDVLVIGGGPAGLSVSLHCAFASLNVAFIEKNVPGGKLVNIKSMRNIPGYKSIDGDKLALAMYEQVTDAGAKYIYGEVTTIGKKKNLYTVTTSDNITRLAKTVVIASGVGETPIKLSVANKYTNKGVSYCFTCDGMLAKNKNIVICGENYGKTIKCIKYLANIAKTIYIINNNKFDFSEFKTTKNIKIYDKYDVTGIFGKENIEQIQVSTKDGKKELIPASFLFINNNSTPVTNFIFDKKIIDKNGVIITNENCQTPEEGIFAIGDVHKKDVRSVSICIGDAYQASKAIINYLELIKK